MDGCILPAKIPSKCLRYNGLGQRVSQTVSSVVTEYLLDVQPGLWKVIAADDGTDVNRYIYDPVTGGIFQHEDPSSDWNWPALDGLGTVRGIYDDTLSEVYAADRDPYGDLIAATGSNPTPFEYTGEPEDPNGLLHLRARYYDPNLAVFNSRDPLELGNRYQYALSNPATKADPSGLCPFGICDIDIEGAISSAGSDILNIPGERLGAIGLQEEMDWAIAQNLILMHTVIDTGTQSVYDHPELAGAIVGVGLIILLGYQAPKLGIGATANLAVGLVQGKYAGLPAGELVLGILEDTFAGANSYEFSEAAYGFAQSQTPGLTTVPTLPIVGFGPSEGPGLPVPIPPNLFSSPQPADYDSCPVEQEEVDYGCAGDGLSLFRSMKEAPDGINMPLTNESDSAGSARRLDVRVGDDILVENDLVQPNSGGMSVAPETPFNLPSFRRTPEFGGTSRDPVWCIAASIITVHSELRYDQDSDTHGTIQPSKVMSLQEYREALWSTKAIWVKV